jgi:hypothetical protein
MNLFDRMIDAFSEKDLRRRIRCVVAIGLSLSILTVAGAYKFANMICTIDADGMALLLPDGNISISLTDEKAVLLSASTPLDALLITTDGGEVMIKMKIISIDPDTKEVTARTSDLPKSITPNSHFRVTIVLDRQPYWKLLWGAGDKAL